MFSFSRLKEENGEVTKCNYTIMWNFILHLIQMNNVVKLGLIQLQFFFSKRYETDFICDLPLATTKVRPEKKHSTQESFIINVSYNN